MSPGPVGHQVRPPHLVADYMSVTFFTGVLVSSHPCAFQLVATVSIATMGIICTALIVAASLLLLPELMRYKVV